MLAFAEDFLRRIRDATTDGDILVLLAQLARQLGYRSAFLIEYASRSKTLALVFDSNAARAGWWDRFNASGLRGSDRSIARLLALGGVQYLDGTRFSDTQDVGMALARRVDMVDSALVPIHLDHEIVGLVAFCGDKRLCREQEQAVQFVCYNLFSQARSFHHSGIKLAGPGLTPRECQVITLSSSGLTAQQVGDRLGVSSRTVHQHMDNVADKLGTLNRVHSVAEAIRRDLLPEMVARQVH